MKILLTLLVLAMIIFCIAGCSDCLKQEGRKKDIRARIIGICAITVFVIAGIVSIYLIWSLVP